MPAEAQLNWQAENAIAQNQVLTKIAKSQDRMETRMTNVDNIVHDLKGKIKDLHIKLLHVATTVKNLEVSNQFISQKEKGKKEAQLRDLVRQQEASSLKSAQQPLLQPALQSPFAPMVQQPTTTLQALPS